MRRALVVLALVGLVGLAGCTGGVVDERALAEPATYDWNTTTDAHVNVTGGSYQAVLSTGTQTNVSLFGPGQFGDQAALPVRSVQFQYPNGTVVNASGLTVSEAGDRTVIDAPVPDGKIAYTAQVRSNQLFVPISVNGSYAVTLPEGAAVEAPIIGGASPGGYELDQSGERVRLVWANPEAEIITVDYYQQRNLYIFLALAGTVGLIAAAGVLYFRAQIRSLSRRTGTLAPEDHEER